MNGNNWVKFAAVIIIFGILTYLVSFGAPALGIPSIEEMRLGIDIKGGIYTVLYPDIQDGSKPTDEQLQAARTVIEKRLDNKGIYDRNVAIESEYGRIVVEIPYKPGETDLNPQKAIDELGATALLTFQEVDEAQVDEKTGLPLPTGRIVIEGKHVKDANVQSNPQTGEVVVALELNDEGAERFAEATGRLVGKRIAIFMDDNLIVAPVVNEMIPNGQAIITGQRDAKEAGELADTIRAGALPFKLVPRHLSSITPLLGEGALNVTINAGIIAFILICLFMIVYYRLPGIVASIALFGLIVMQLLAITVLKVSLTLPGIAGIILSIGMGVDANVIIFERIKEELRNGKTLGLSVDLGFKRAFAAILDSNVTTLITAIVLYWLGTGPIRGFAVTLAIGVALSFITAITATKTMLRALAGVKAFKNHKLYGVKGGAA
ncbi:MAG TPA: protein translocase subunit SecD [Clostridiaceae bacterium]|nr:protein translocase subunit SecD [Clostridiaceae bacterium]